MKHSSKINNLTTLINDDDRLTLAFLVYKDACHLSLAEDIQEGLL